MASSSNVLRMSGMNSGLDTESIVNALSANTKLKITKNERKVLKLQAQQDAYRDVISKMTTFQNTYFDILNSKTYLKSSNIFNQYTAKATASDGSSPVGVTVSTSPNASEGSNTVTLLGKATQSTRKGTSFSDNASPLDIAAYTGTGEEYNISVTVGSKSASIGFASGATAAETITNINESLKAAFGTKNDGDGIVALDSTNKIVSSDKAGVTTSAVSAYQSSASINLSGVTDGTSTLSFVHNGTTRTVTVKTLSSDHFDKVTAGTASADLQTEYDNLVTDFYNSQALYSYLDWSKTATTADRESLYDTAWANEQTSEEFTTAYNTALTASGMSDTDFRASQDYQDFLTDYETDYKANTYAESVAYKSNIFPSTSVGQMDESTFAATVTNEQLVQHYNRSYLENTVGSLTFVDGTKLSLDWTNASSPTISASFNGVAQTFSVSADETSDNTFGLDKQTSTVTTVSTTSKLSELGATANADGKYVFQINGAKLEFDGDTTVKQLISGINASDAGVKLSLSTLTNSFTLTANDYGTNAEINIADTDGTDLLSKMGFSSTSGFIAGTNLQLEVDGIQVESASNSYEVNGTTFTFSAAAKIGDTFTNEVTRDYTQAIDTIKNFVTDYNKLIEDVYKYVDEEPNDDYYFLTDTDKEDMDLSDKQEEKWDTVAKQGLLYNDSSITSIMSKMRTALYTSTTMADGSKMALYNIGITTSSDYKKHGTLVLDEDALKDALDTNAEAVADLFTNSSTGIMTTLDTVLDSAVKTTGAREDKGILIQKAGLANSSSSTDNSIYDQIQSLTTLIDSLQERYEQEQDRYWSVYSNLETQMGNLNKQTSSISSLLSSS